MPKEPQQARRLRKGTKSCVECRERKIRCIWPDDDESSHVCNNCQARGRACVPQVVPTPSVVTMQLTSRDRIRRLEQEVSSLWSVLRDGGAARPRGSIGQGFAAESLDEIQEDDVTEHESEASELSPPNGPAHLRQLFDNDLLNVGDAAWSVQAGLNNGLVSSTSLTSSRKQLQRLLPPRTEVVAVVPYSNAWTAVYNGMFATMHPVETGDELLGHYEDLRKPDAQPTAIANALLSLTLTLQQIPDEEVLRDAPSMHVSSGFSQRVIDTVEKLIIHNDRVACTISGIETTLFFVRLSLATVEIRKVWLLLRRAIAIAELIGMPRISKMLEAQKFTATRLDPAQQEQMESAAAMWHSIRSIERMAGVLFNLPVSTAMYPMQHAPSLMVDGHVSYPAFLGRMSDIVAGVQDLDDLVPSAQSESDRLFKVLKIDSNLRQLATQTPPSWWEYSQTQELVIDHLLQLFFQYYLARTHIQLALSDDATGRYNYSYTTCLNACKDMTYRYVALRPLVPAGFFVCRVVDLQIITGAVFLLFTMRKEDKAKTQSPLSAELSGLMERVIQVLDSVTKRSGSDFASKALEALRSLNELMDSNGNPNSSSEAITLRIPLLGKVHVSRKGAAGKPTQVAQPDQMTQQNGSMGAPSAFAGFPGMTDYNALPGFDMGWSMDVMDDSPLLPLDTWDASTWLPNMDYNGNTIAPFPM